jgi:hypothetical protein
MYCPSAIVYHPVDPRRTTEGLLSQMVLQRRQVDRTRRRRFKRRHLLFRDSALDVARRVHSFCKMVSKP